MNKGKVRDNEYLGRKKELIYKILLLKKKTKYSDYAKKIKKKSGKKLAEIYQKVSMQRSRL